MSDAILWLEKNGKRWALEPRGNDLRWKGSSGSLAFEGIGNTARLPLGADVNDSRDDITRDDAIALVRRLAPAFGYVVRERVTFTAWVVADGKIARRGDGLTTLSHVRDGRWRVTLPDADGWLDSGPADTLEHGMAAADRWLTENAPWVTLEGGAYTVPEVVPEAIQPGSVEPGSDADWDEALRIVREVGPQVTTTWGCLDFVWASGIGDGYVSSAGVGPRATAAEAARAYVDSRKAFVEPAAPTPATPVDLAALEARVAALEGAPRPTPVGVPLSVEAVPFGDGDGFAVLVTLPSGRGLSVYRDDDRALTTHRDMRYKYRTQREVDFAVRYWRGVFGLGVA